MDRRTKLTHIVAGDECAEKLPLTPGQIQRRHIQVVAPEWIEECLAQGRLVDEEKYRVHLEFCCESGVCHPGHAPPIVLLTWGVCFTVCLRQILRYPLR